MALGQTAAEQGAADRRLNLVFGRLIFRFFSVLLMCSRLPKRLHRECVEAGLSTESRLHVPWPENRRGLTQFPNANDDSLPNRRFTIASSSGLHLQRIKVGQHATFATA
jgi:hypothetical protein